MASGDATPVPVKNTAYRVTFPILDADGDLVAGATGLDSEISKDAGTFADCTNEATQIATSSGMYYLDLTATEMNADTVAVIVKSTEGKTTPIVMYPQESGDINVNIESIDSGVITAAAIATDAIGSAELATTAVNEIRDAILSDSTPFAGADIAAILTDTGTTLDNHLTDIKGTGFVKDTHSLIDIETYVDLIDDGTSGLAKIATDVAAILVDSNELQTDWADGGRLDLILDARASQTTADAIETDTQDIQSRLPAALVSGRMDSNVAAIADNTVAANSLDREYGNIDVDNNLSSATASTIVFDDAGMSAVDDFYNGMVAFIFSGAGAGQSRTIVDYVGATKTATVSPDWGTTPTTTSDVMVLPAGSVNTGDAFARLGAPAGASVSADIATVDTVVDGIQTDLDNGTDGLGALKTLIDTVDTNVDSILVDTNELQTDWVNGGRLDLILDSIQADTDDIQSRLPAALVGGRMDSDVGGISGPANFLAMYDGTGYAGGATSLNVNVTKLQGATNSASVMTAFFAGSIDVNVVSATSNTIQFDSSSFSTDDDHYNGMTIMIWGGTGYGQARLITDYTGSTKTATVSPNWGTTPDATSDATIIAIGSTHFSTPDVNVASVNTGAITADAIAADAIGASELATDAVNEIRDSILADSTAFNGADIAAILTDTGTTLDNHLTDIKGTGFVKDTHSLIDIETYVDLIDDGTSGLAKIATDVAAILVDTADMQPKLGTPAADLSADVAAIKAETALIVADTNELQTDWVDGGRLDLLLDDCHALVQTSATINDGTPAAGNFDGSAGLSATDDFYNGMILLFTSGTYAGIARRIDDYTGSSKNIVLENALTGAPSNGDAFIIVGLEFAPVSSAPTAATIADAVWDEAVADHAGAGSTGKALADIETDATAILADTNELQTDWVDGGRLDLIIDSILVDTGTTLDDHLTDIKGTGFVKDTHSLIDIETYVDLIDDGTSGLAKIATDVAAILVDTNELQTDWVDGGRLDLILDAITGITPLATGTAQSGAANSIQLAAAHTFANSELNGNIVNIISGTGAGQSRIINSYTGSTDTAFVIPNWTTTPDATSQYEVVQGAANLTSIQSASGVPANSQIANIKSHFDGDGKWAGAGGYQDGAVWVDTNWTNTGTANYQDGTVDNPLNNISDANDIVNALECNHRIRVVSGSSATLAAGGMDNFEIEGLNYTLDLNGQSISGTTIKGALISASTCTGATDPLFSECQFNGNVTLPGCTIKKSGFADITVTLADASVYNLNDCHHLGSGLSDVSFDFGAAVANTTLNIDGWHGALELQNMGQSGTDVAYIVGAGHITINANCTGGTIYLIGSFSVTDNGSAAVNQIDIAQTGDSFARLGAPAGASVSADIAAIQTDTTAIVADTNELQTDWTDGGRLDLIIDSILVDTGTTLDDHLTDIKGTGFVKDTHSLIDIETYVDLIDDGTSGLAKIATDVAAILVDTNELQGDWVDGGRLDLILDARASQTSVDTVDSNVDAILVDTNELQGDWTDGGRLDLLLDDIHELVQTSGSISDVGPTSTDFDGDAGLSATDDFYNGMILIFTSGTYAGIGRRIDDYTGASKNIVLENALTGAPGNGDTFVIVGLELPSTASTPPTAAAIADAVWDEAVADHAGAGSTGKALADIETDATAILADTNELQGDWVDGGRLDLIIDSILVDTGTTLDDHLTDIKGTGFVKDTHSLIDIETYVDLIDDGTSGLAKIATDVAAILVDTNELQGDWTDGGRLDLILDNILSDTDDIQTRLPAALVGGKMDCDATAISGSTDAADHLEVAYSGLHTDTDVASATSSTIVFNAAEMSSVDDYYNGMICVVYNGTGAGQSRLIRDYTGSTKTAIVTPDWATNPDATSDAVILPAGGPTVDASGLVSADVIAVSGDSTAADNLESACDNYSAERGLAGTALPAAAADAAGGLPISDAGGLDMDAILVDTNSLNDTKIPDTLSLANINSEIDTALADIHLDHLLAVDYDPASKPGVGTALLNELVEDDGGVSRFTSNALEQGPSGAGSDRLLMVDTTIATLASQTSFTLTAGSTDDDAYNNCTIVIEDAATSAQKAVSIVSDYTGSTKTVTLLYDPAIFTMAVSDKIYILAESSLKGDERDRQFSFDNAGTPQVSLYSISGTGLSDTGAADNLKLFLDSDGGYSGAGGYGGAVWVDPTWSNSGTATYTDGVFDKPSGSLATAATIINAAEITRRIRVNTGASVTVPSDFFKYQVEGLNYTLDLNSEDVSGCTFKGALIAAGTCTGTPAPLFEDCQFNGNVTLPECIIKNSAFGDITVTLNAAAVFNFSDCYHLGSGLSDVTFDFGAAVGNTTLNMDNFNGTVNITNLGQSGTDVVFITGRGKVTVDATCTGGDIYLLGHFGVTDNGSATIHDSESFSGNAAGYDDGAVWIDTNASNTNTTDFTDGVVSNPVSTIAAAKTIADSVGLKRFRVLGGSSFTFAATMDNYEFIGENYTINLGSQSCAGTYIEGAILAASTCTGAAPIFDRCRFDANVTLPACIIRDSTFGNITITLSSAGTYYIHHCVDNVSGTSGVTFDFGAAVGTTNLNMHDYYGSVILDNMGQSGTDTAVLIGSGRVTVDATSTSGNVFLTGFWKATNNGAVTVTTDEAFPDGIPNAVWNEPQAGYTTAGTFGDYLDAMVSQGVSPPTAATIAAAVWDESLDTHLIAGTAGRILYGAATATRQNEILTQLAGGAISVKSTIATAGRLIIKQGDDHTLAAGNALTLNISDTGQPLYDKIQDPGISSIKAGFRRSNQAGGPSDIEGVISKARITHSNDVTTIPIEMNADDTVGKELGEYKYDIQLTTNTGKIVTVLTDSAILRPDNAN